jgi:hypothetical protein
MLNAAIRRLQQQLQGKTHAAVAVNVGEPDTHTKVVSVMTQEKKQELTPEEAERQEGAPLPERTQMSVIHPGAQPVPAFSLTVEPPTVDET